MRDDLKEIIFPEEVAQTVMFYQVSLKNNKIEALLSVRETNTWLIGKMIEDGGFHVIAEFKKYDEKLRVTR